MIAVLTLFLCFSVLVVFIIAQLQVKFIADGDTCVCVSVVSGGETAVRLSVHELLAHLDPRMPVMSN